MTFRMLGDLPEGRLGWRSLGLIQEPARQHGLPGEHVAMLAHFGTRD